MMTNIVSDSSFLSHFCSGVSVSGLPGLEEFSLIATLLGMQAHFFCSSDSISMGFSKPELADLEATTSCQHSGVPNTIEFVCCPSMEVLELSRGDFLAHLHILLCPMFRGDAHMKIVGILDQYLKKNAVKGQVVSWLFAYDDIQLAKFFHTGSSTHQHRVHS